MSLCCMCVVESLNRRRRSERWFFFPLQFNIFRAPNAFCAPPAMERKEIKTQRFKATTHLGTQKVKNATPPPSPPTRLTHRRYCMHISYTPQGLWVYMDKNTVATFLRMHLSFEQWWRQGRHSGDFCDSRKSSLRSNILRHSSPVFVERKNCDFDKKK